jgi:hypothetical protein
MQQRWLPESAGPGELREALRSDLLATRRGPEGQVDAMTVWAEFRVVLLRDPAVSKTSEFGRIESSMIVVSEVARKLEHGTATDDDVAQGAVAADSVAVACRDLHRKVRRLVAG